MRPAGLSSLELAAPVRREVLVGSPPARSRQRLVLPSVDDSAAQVRVARRVRPAALEPGEAVIASRDQAFTPGAIRASGKPALLAYAGIHAGEIDGKDAGLMLLRDLAFGKPQALLDRAHFLFVPVFNVDGHERISAWNRPNQRGPVHQGWRTTAQNRNLNRDYMKADTPEMQAMLRLLNEWAPALQLDLHVTDGADFEPDISLQVEPINQGAPSLRASGVAMRDQLIDKLAAQGHLPLPFYPDFATTDDPSSGFVLTVSGYIINRERIEISPRFLGMVKWIGVKKGDTVKKDDVIVQLDDAEQRARLLEIEGQLANAEVAVEQAKNGFCSRLARSMKSSEAPRNSSSTVSILFLVSGPVSSHFCLPHFPKRGSSPGVSVVVATHFRTPRGPYLALNVGSFG